MSRIYFHSIDGEAEVLGSERAHFGCTCSDITFAMISRDVNEWHGTERSILRDAFPKYHYIHESKRFAEDVRLYLSVGDDSLIVDGQEIRPFPLVLNTVLAVGSDPIKLMARIHGQCETHAYVEGKNRQWLSDIIKQGMKMGLYRGNQGWGSVIELLRKDNGLPVVMSYSVCEFFPNARVANFVYRELEDGGFDYDVWDGLPREERWEMGMRGLRESGGGLELKQDNWDDFYFEHGMNIMQLVTRLREVRNERIS